MRSSQVAILLTGHSDYSQMSIDLSQPLDLCEFSVTVEVRLREGIADPEGLTIQQALPALGFEGVSNVRVGKALRFVVTAHDENAARQQAQAMCERFLINPVIEDAVVHIVALGDCK
ncbi:MAG: phosphoribosylformylglycinamidine synthase subunit PurS [Acidimicrobiia bacterium]|nr:phosphoribosylformylglycinamidine synthase subunit PurS [Acidimicrobiia bacterium]MYC57508.1 phosphoribosylformylglycinamidine synthase subunit PurS [Acidimicrobiia bacterium]MYG94948.1 phosphoribosylformylglycinamidine synthase subunit PurS [Acidimicrobiia bacterium]MYI29778.1 phosphoribosylformylglycinamidine synthase subunit PurS [Acidimicrobiia bacterium]